MKSQNNNIEKKFIENNFIAGVDLGGTKMAVMLANAQGILAKEQADVQLSGDKTTLARQALGMLQTLAQQENIAMIDIQAVGIMSCSPFVKIKQTDGSFAREVAAPNLCGGLGGNPYNLPNTWTSFPLDTWLSAHWPTASVEQDHAAQNSPVFVLENDCVAILQAERLFGAASGSDHCAYATWSTGVGFGLCVDGKLLAGKNGNAGHAGHTYVTDSGVAGLHQCGCGNVGDLESMVSGKALAKAWQIAQNDASMTTRDLFEAEQAGNPQARDIIHAAAKHFGQALYNLVVTLDLDTIVMGGSVFMRNQGLLLALLQAQMLHGMPALTWGAKLIPAKHGANAGDLGALSLVMPKDWISTWKH